MSLSRLWSKLGLTKPLFEVRFDGSNTFLNDHSISSITIDRGSGSTLAGLQPGTCEVKFPEKIDYYRYTAKTMRVRMNPTVLQDLIDRLVLPTTTTAIEYRFAGRVGALDYSWGPSQRFRELTLMAGSWAAQEANSAKTTTVGKGADLFFTLGNVLYRRGTHYSYISHGTADKANEAIEEQKFSDLWSKYATNLEYPAPVHRNGNIHIWSLPALKAETDARISRHPHVLLAQVFAPAKWEQPNEDLAAKYQMRYSPNGTVISTVTREVSSVVAPDFDIIDLDWTHFWATTLHWNQALHAIMFRASTQQWFMKEIKVDILRLLSSDSAYDKRMGSHFLTLEVADSLNLSGDWPSEVRGVYLAAGIKETITPDEWTLTVSLIPYVWVFGSNTPAVPGRVWDAIRSPWNDQTQTWNQIGDYS